MGAVAGIARSGGNVQLEMFTLREHLIEMAVSAVNKVKGDIKSLPFNLMKIFQQYATDPLVFRDEEDYPIVSGNSDGFCLTFISTVLSRVWAHDYGSFSHVYYIDETHVMKVNCASNLWSPQDGCFGWLKTCTNFQHNPYAPKLVAIEQSFHLFFAVMERLEFGVGLAFDNGCLGDLSFESYDPDFEVTAYMKDSSVPFGFTQFIRHCPESAIEIARGFEQYRDSVSGVEDISAWNIMHRNGFPVLTDPICDVKAGLTDMECGTSFSWMSID